MSIGILGLLLFLCLYLFLARVARKPEPLETRKEL